MKYIRTHSEIYDVNDLYVCEELVDKPYATKNGGWCIYKDSIVKQADTIEELCDEFVVSGNTSLGKPFVSSKEFKNLQEQNDIRLYDNCELFGAIWTDKGLIYVAKMNDKGELELI